jgi:hypothetical protein
MANQRRIDQAIEVIDQARATWGCYYAQRERFIKVWSTLTGDDHEELAIQLDCDRFESDPCKAWSDCGPRRGCRAPKKV